MGAQSISNLANFASTAAQIQFALPFASKALADALSATARTGRDPLSAGAQNLRSDFSTRAVELRVESDQATTALLQLGTIDAALQGAVDTLEELNGLAVAAASTDDTTTRANLNAAFQASLASISDSLGSANATVGAAFARAYRSNGTGLALPTGPQAGTYEIDTFNGGGIGDIVTSSIRVVGGASAVPEEGLEIAFRVPNVGTGADTFNRSGSRAVRGGAIRNFDASGNLTGDIEFEVVTHVGSQTFSFANGTHKQDILDTLNAAQETLGAQAFFNSAAQTQIHLRTNEFGYDTTLTVNQITDVAANHIVNGFDRGQNARAEFHNLATGEFVDVEADGRSFSFTLSGVELEVDFYTGPFNVNGGASLLTENNDLGNTNTNNTRIFQVERGGVDLGGGAFASIPELSFGELGGGSGRLSSAEIQSNPVLAKSIIAETQAQLAEAIARVGVKEAEVNTKIAQNASERAEIDNNVSAVENISGLVASFEAVRLDAERQSAFALLSQISSFFPSSILPLLDAQR